jgi:hypothetical protein
VGDDGGSSIVASSSAVTHPRMLRRQRCRRSACGRHRPAEQLAKEVSTRRNKNISVYWGISKLMANLLTEKDVLSLAPALDFRMSGPPPQGEGVEGSVMDYLEEMVYPTLLPGLEKLLSSVDAGNEPRSGVRWLGEFLLRHHPTEGNLKVDTQFTRNVKKLASIRRDQRLERLRIAEERRVAEEERLRLLAEAEAARLAAIEAARLAAIQAEFERLEVLRKRRRRGEGRRQAIRDSFYELTAIGATLDRNTIMSMELPEEAVKRVADVICPLAVKYCNAQHCMLCLLEGPDLISFCAQSDYDISADNNDKPLSMEYFGVDVCITRGEGLLWKCVDDSQVVKIDDMASIEADAAKFFKGRSPGGLLAVPIFIPGSENTCGCIVLDNLRQQEGALAIDATAIDLLKGLSTAISEAFLSADDRKDIDSWIPSDIAQESVESPLVHVLSPPDSYPDHPSNTPSVDLSAFAIMGNQIVLGSETGNRRRLGFWASNSLSRELGGKRVIVAIQVEDDGFELRADSVDHARVRAGLVVHSDDDAVTAALASPAAPVVVASSILSDGHRALLCCISHEREDTAHPIGIVCVCSEDEKEDSFISKALLDLSHLLAELYVTSTFRCEFTRRFDDAFKYLAFRYPFPNGIALGYFTDGANIVIASVSDGSPNHFYVGQVIENPITHEVPLQSVIIDGNDNIKAVLLIAKSDIDSLTLQHTAEISGPWHVVKCAVSASSLVMKELQHEINSGLLRAFQLFPVTKRSSQKLHSNFIRALQQEALSLVSEHVSQEKVCSFASFVVILPLIVFHSSMRSWEQMSLLHSCCNLCKDWSMHLEQKLENGVFSKHP